MDHSDKWLQMQSGLWTGSRETNMHRFVFIDFILIHLRIVNEHTFNDSRNSIVCPAGTFRSSEVTKCSPCPLNSKASKSGSAYCGCIDGFYRHPRDSKHMPCYRPPTKPTNLTLLFVDQTSAILSWNAPVRPANELYDSKYRSDTVFRVKCPTCNSNVVFIPASETFNDTKLTVNNLEPVTSYTIQIHSLNSISYPIHTDIDGSNDNNITDYQSYSNLHINSGSGPTALNKHPTEYAEITFTTESAILSTVFNTRIISITSHEVELQWDKPLHNDIPIESYEVRWFPKSELDAVNKTMLSTHELHAHIENLMENTEYGFQVRCKTANGFGTYSNIVYGQTHQSVSPGKTIHHMPELPPNIIKNSIVLRFYANSVYDDSMQMRILAGGTVAFVCVLVLGE